MDEKLTGPENEAAICKLIKSWAAAVRRKDLPAILQNHAPDIVMFDVPPPFQIRGIQAYEKSWSQFFSWSGDTVAFDIATMTITAGDDVAFAVATVRCAEAVAGGGSKPLDFRLTIGLRKNDGRWTITHEHHSIPAVD